MVQRDRFLGGFRRGTAGANGILIGAIVALGCSSDPPRGTAGQGNFTPQVGACNGAPEQGCPCSTEGAEGQCGKVIQNFGDYLSCSIGVTKCEGGKWSTCTGDQVTTKAAPRESLKTLGLGMPGPCVNPCQPQCSTVVDTPDGLDAGADASVRVTEAGVELVPGSAGSTGCTALAITPTTAPAKDIVVSGAGPWEVQFTAALTPAGCYPGIFAPLWSVDKFDLADISATGRLSLISPIAGPIQVRAFGGSLTSNTVTTNVTINRTTVSVTTPPSAGVTAASFPPVTGTEPADADLTFLYPYDGTMFPLALPSPLVQWRRTTAAAGVKVTLRYPPTGAALFESSEIRAESTTFPVPLRAAEPRAVIPQADWASFEQTINRNRATFGDTGLIRVQRFIGGVAQAPRDLSVRFAPTQLKGRIYYNTYGTALVANYSGAQQSPGGAFPGGAFGAATLQIRIGDTAPTVVAGTTSSCRVCHSASSDGQFLITNDGGYNSFKYALPGAGPLGAAYGNSTFVFPGIHPNKNRVYPSSGAHSGPGNSRLYDGNGALVAGATQPTNLRAGYPAFSHEATGAGKVAFTFAGGSPAPLANPASGPVAGDGRTLSMMDFDGDRTFSNFRNLYTNPSRKAWWPSFLPIGQDGIVFHLEQRGNGRDPGGTRSDCEGGCLTGVTSELWWVSTGATPIARRLDVMNGYSGAATGYLPTGPNRHSGVGGDPTYYEQVYNYEPTVLPEVRGGFNWVTFTARRMYGNVATINPYASDPRFYNTSIDPTPKKLWISAMNANAAPGTDPSYPAFYVPGQELISGNMRGYFALDGCRVAGLPKVPQNECESDLDCCAGTVCALDRPISSPAKRYCVSNTPSACKADGLTCTLDSECCNFASGIRCASGICAPPPPIYSSGTFDREYEGTCPAGTSVAFGLYQWQAIIPAGTSIFFTAEARNSSIQPWGAPVPIGSATSTTATWTSGPQTIAQALLAAGQPRFANQVRVRANLSVGSPPNSTPVLTQWRLTYDCIDNE